MSVDVIRGIVRCIVHFHYNLFVSKLLLSCQVNLTNVYFIFLAYVLWFFNDIVIHIKILTTWTYGARIYFSL